MPLNTLITHEEIPLTDFWKCYTHSDMALKTTINTVLISNALLSDDVPLYLVIVFMAASMNLTGQWVSMYLAKSTLPQPDRGLPAPSYFNSVYASLAQGIIITH